VTRAETAAAVVRSGKQDFVRAAKFCSERETLLIINSLSRLVGVKKRHLKFDKSFFRKFLGEREGVFFLKKTSRINPQTI
jgi:hypothetical protein